MKRSDRRVKRHIISLRVSREEWDSLHEIMKGLQLQRVSDLMREAIKEVLAPSGSLDTPAEGRNGMG